MSKNLLCLTFFAMVVMAAPVRADTLSGLADVTAVDGAIVSLRYAETEYIVADGDLLLGSTTRWYIDANGVEILYAEGDPTPDATVNGTSTVKSGDVGSKADNFLITLDGKENMSSIDGINFQETIFAVPSDTFFVFERGGNDTGSMQAILADGTLGAEVAFVKPGDGGPYADTGVSAGSQKAFGVVFKTDVPVQGVRITASGHDTLSISALAPEPINVATVAELEAAAADASAGDRIILAEGTYDITSQIEIKDGVTYRGAGPGLTIIDGNDLTRAFVAWGDRGATDGQIDDANNAVPNLTGPKGWVLDGLTIQNCVSDANNRQDILSAARDLLTNYTGTPYTLVTAGEENGAIADNPDAFEALSGGADDDLTDVELQAYLDNNPPGSAGHYVINGEMHTKGGAIIMLNGAKGTIRNCTFLNNSAVNDGGAIYANLSPFNAVGDAGISLEGVTIDGCTAGDDGGGLCVDSSGDDPNSVPAIVINSAMVTNCRAGGPAPDDGDRDGGGIYLNNRLNVTITSTLVDTCTAGRHGAGIMMDGQVVAELDGCQISNCANDVIDGEGGDGAAISIDTDASIVRISNCIFNNNVNSQDDGIVRVDAHEAMIINCTFVGNVSAADQGIVRYSTDEDDASVHNGVVNCMFVNNDPSGGSDQVIAHNKGNVTYTYTNNAFFGNIMDEGDSHIDSIADEDLGLFGNLLLTTDPLVDTAGGDYHLAVGSEAIDAGTADGAPDHDIEGNARPQGAAPDIGAYESPAN